MLLANIKCHFKYKNNRVADRFEHTLWLCSYAFFRQLHKTCEFIYHYYQNTAKNQAVISSGWTSLELNRLSNHCLENYYKVIFQKLTFQFSQVNFNFHIFLCVQGFRIMHLMKAPLKWSGVFLCISNLVVQWLRFYASTAGDMGSIPGWGIKILHDLRLLPTPKRKGGPNDRTAFGWEALNDTK